jgi:hypothetical protein
MALSYGRSEKTRKRAIRGERDRDRDRETERQRQTERDARVLRNHSIFCSPYSEDGKSLCFHFAQGCIVIQEKKES